MNKPNITGGQLLLLALWQFNKSSHATDATRAMAHHIERGHISGIKVTKSGVTVSVTDEQALTRSALEAILCDSTLQGLLREAEHLQLLTIKQAKRPQQPQATWRYPMHALSQNFASPRYVNLFTQDVIKHYPPVSGQQLAENIKDFGISFNVTQQRVHEAIVRMFSRTSFLGHRQIPAGEAIRERYDMLSSDHVKVVKKAYENIKAIPEITVTQAELIREAGYSSRHGDKIDVLQALNYLATKQFCFFWTRRARAGGYDADGRPRLEDVQEVGMLWRVQEVKDEATGSLLHYVIQPSAVMLDHVNEHYGGSYYVTIAQDWRQSVYRALNRQPSKYTLIFMLWLMREYEQMRSRKQQPVRRVSLPYMAEALKMPESLRIANRKRALTIVIKAFDDAVKAGYLSRYEDSGVDYVLFFNPKKYHNPEPLAKPKKENLPPKKRQKRIVKKPN